MAIVQPPASSSLPDAQRHACPLAGNGGHRAVKVLITGASGFIGGAFLRRFAADPRVSLYGTGRRTLQDLPPGASYQALPLDQLQTLDFDPDVVIHAAGRASPWGSAAQYYRDNIETTRQVIAFCHARQLPRLIFISTAAVYYRFAHQYHLAEHAAVEQSFTSEYGRSKYLAEQLVNDYAGEKTIFRPCAVFGAGDALLLPPLLEAARKKRLVNLRSEHPAQAEIMHVTTLCDYLMLAAMSSHLKPCYNISAANPLATQALLQTVLNHFDLPVPTRTLSVATALRIAAVLEWLWRRLPPGGEPPITRFGVGVFGYSATLDVSLMLEDFGAPRVPFPVSLTRFLQDYKAQRR